MRQFLLQQKQAGRCVLFSTHIMQEVAALCDRVVIIARGCVVANGTPDELRARAGQSSLEEAFMHLIGSEGGTLA
jgi:sodium transport system ATP-binding protein